MKTVAIIPARGGSKGIPKKNIIDLCGKPLIAWSIIQAIKTQEIDGVFVSSDSDEILNIAQTYGANIIKRPPEISGDMASSESAVQHAIQTIDFPIQTVIMLQPTSPLRKPDDLSRALEQFRDEELDSLFSGAILDDFLIWEKDSEDLLRSYNYDFRNRGRRQDRQLQYAENGSLYIFKPEIIATGNRLGGKLGIYIMDFWQTFEIDTPEDLDWVRLIFDLKVKHLYNGLIKQ